MEMGTHAELIARKDYYARLHKMQFHDAVEGSTVEV
jgi:hypothetical protein